MFFKAAVTVKKLKQILGWKSGGVHKRIDENRELLELLQREAPEFLDNHPWVNGWLECHDEFFVELEKLVAIDEGQFVGQLSNPHSKFPRPFPAIANK